MSQGRTILGTSTVFLLFPNLVSKSEVEAVVVLVIFSTSLVLNLLGLVHLIPSHGFLMIQMFQHHSMQ